MESGNYHEGPGCWPPSPSQLSGIWMRAQDQSGRDSGEGDVARGGRGIGFCREGYSAGMATQKGEPAMGPSLPFSVFSEEAPEWGSVVSAPALPGCHTHGETLEEAEQNMREAIAVYLESLAAEGRLGE